MNAKSILLLGLLLTLLLSGCATHELVLSRTLRPVLSRDEVNFSVTGFRARVQMDRMEVWARVKRLDSDYRTGFELEIDSTAALCAALGKSDLAFEHEWRVLKLELTQEYGSQWRWQNTVGHTVVTISRTALLELRQCNAPVAEYPKYWRLSAGKVGPPDYIPQEWLAGDTEARQPKTKP